MKYGAVHDVHNCFVHQAWQDFEDHFGREIVAANARYAVANDRNGVLYVQKGTLKVFLVYVERYPVVEEIAIRRVEFNTLEVVQLIDTGYLNLLDVGLVRDLLENDFWPQAVESIGLHQQRIAEDDVFVREVKFGYATHHSFAQLELHGKLGIVTFWL
jgi:hypothetical protein